MNKKKLTKKDIILSTIALVFMQLALFFGVVMLIGMVQIYAENFTLIHTSFETECLCRVAIAAFALLIGSAWFELDKICNKFYRKARKELMQHENK